MRQHSRNVIQQQLLLIFSPITALASTALSVDIDQEEGAAAADEDGKDHEWCDENPSYGQGGCRVEATGAVRTDEEKRAAEARALEAAQE